MSVTIDILSLWNLIQFLDLFGTMAFAVTGALKAVEHKLDIFGVIILVCYYGAGWRNYKRCGLRNNPTFRDFRTLIHKYCPYYSNSSILSISQNQAPNGTIFDV